MTVGALDVGQLLQSAGPFAPFLVVVVVLIWLWLRAERRSERLAKRLDDEDKKHSEQLDAERQKRWKAEDTAARARRKSGDLDAKD